MSEKDDQEERVGGITGPQDDVKNTVLSRCPPSTSEALDVDDNDDEDSDPEIVKQEDV